MDRRRRPSAAALEAYVEDSFHRLNRRRSIPPGSRGAPAQTTYEHYKFDEQESSIHLEWRAQRGQAQLRMMRIVTEAFVYSLGLGLGLLVGSMTIASRALHNAVMYATDLALHPDGAEGVAYVGSAFATYTGLNVLIVLLAALLTLWAPAAGSSGLPKLKSYLNGTYLRDGMLSARTLVAKVVGITLITSTNMPLGRDGPMVHIGAMCAAILTRAKIPGTAKLLDLRLPAPQREWVAVGAVAGVAAAFNAPIGGILYSFEEVSSGWNSMLTWRSFVCAACVSVAYNVLVEYADGWLHSGYHIELGLGEESHALMGTDVQPQVFWVALLGLSCGIIGGMYNKCVFAVNGLRIKYGRPAGTDGKRRVVEAVLLSFVVFATLFGLATTYPCRPCPKAGMPTVGAHVLSMGEEGCTFTKYRYKANVGLVAHTCPVGEYNEMATLLFSSQEGIVELLFSRHEPGQPEEPLFSTRALASLLGVIFVLSVCIFGIAVPGDNFVPGIVMGGLSGRLFGELLREAGIHPGLTPGAFALLGAGAVLTGMSRMTITLVAILTEVGGDVAIMPAIIIALVVARIAATRLSDSFDDGLMRLHSLPFLEEAPPPELNFLTAGNAMATKVVVLPDVCKVRRIVDILNSCAHNGFPVVYSQARRASELALEEKRQEELELELERSPAALQLLRQQEMVAREGEMVTDEAAKRTSARSASLPSNRPNDDRSPGVLRRSVTMAGSLGLSSARQLQRRVSAASLASQGRRKHSAILKDAAIAADGMSSRSLSPCSRRSSDGDLVNSQSIADEVLDAHNYDASIKLGGTILRRQLKILLKLRVWEGGISPLTLQEEYVGGLMVGLPPSPPIGEFGLSEDDLEATLDLRRYMDPAPFAMVARTPLPRVYRLFNEIGARHLVVVNDNMSPIGMVTRKDLDVPAMVESLLRPKEHSSGSPTADGPADVTVEIGRLRKASKEPHEMATTRAPSKTEYDSLCAAPETQATMMTVTPSMLEILGSEKAVAPDASARGEAAAPEAQRAAAATSGRTPRASKERFRKASKERYEMLEAEETEEPEDSLPPPAKGPGP